MIYESNFIVRASARKEGYFYIDYLGTYKLNDISKIAELDVSIIREKYLESDAIYDSELDIYYFTPIENAEKTINSILKSTKIRNKGKVIVLTEAEIEFIRKALIKDGVNGLSSRNKVKDTIFEKLNK